MAARTRARVALAAVAASIILSWGCRPADAQVSPPAPGTDKIIDRIRAAGVIKAAAIGEFPWLPENTSGTGEPFSGPAWILVKEMAKDLGVKVEIVPVSHETKVPILATGQADITIAPLSATPAREKVVDFIVYSQSSLCLFGRADNPKLKDAAGVDDLDKRDITLAYFTGTPPETWVPARFKAISKRAVAGSGANAPVEEIMSGRADVAPIDNVAWPKLEKAVPGLTVWPKGDACLQSQEMASPVGMAIEKNHPAYLAYLLAVRDSMKGKMSDDEVRVIKTQ